MIRRVPRRGCPYMMQEKDARRTIHNNIGSVELIPNQLVKIKNNMTRISIVMKDNNKLITIVYNCHFQDLLSISSFCQRDGD